MSGMLKVLASGIIILGGGYIGLLIASGFEVRVRQLEQLRLALVQMEFSIGFLKLPLAQAIEGAARSRNGAVSEILLSAAKDVSGGLSPSAALERAMLKNRSELCLKNTDIEIMTEFALRLGEGDRDSELCNINAACAKLKLAYDEAVCDRDSRAKLWRGVGLLAGCFAVVLLI